MADEVAVRQAFARIGDQDHLLVVAGPIDGSWGSFMDEGMVDARSYADNKFFDSWACARYASPPLDADGSITFLTGGIAARSKVGMTAVTSTFAAVRR